MAEIAKYMNVDIANISKIFGISKDGITKFGGVDIPAAGGARGVFGGGWTGAYGNIIDYITVSSIGNAIDFGDLTVARQSLAATSNGVTGRGVFGAGHTGSASDTMDYITILSISNAADFGNLTLARLTFAAASNGTSDRGVFAGGYLPSYYNNIDYITISTTGNATDFGDLSVQKTTGRGTSNDTNDRGVFGAWSSGDINAIDYITISSTGNSTDFGDLTSTTIYGLAATSNGINERGVFGGGTNGSNYFNGIEYITINSLGNATDFGDLTTRTGRSAATSNGTSDRGIFGGGATEGIGVANVIDYITISSVGPAADFGDLTVARYGLAATSNA